MRNYAAINTNLFIDELIRERTNARDNLNILYVIWLITCLYYIEITPQAGFTVVVLIFGAHVISETYTRWHVANMGLRLLGH